LLQPPELINVPPVTVALFPWKLIAFDPVALLAREQLLALIEVLPAKPNPPLFAKTQAFPFAFTNATAVSVMVGSAAKKSPENMRDGVRLIAALIALPVPLAVKVFEAEL
jgi:hypothetical protein